MKGVRLTVNVAFPCRKSAADHEPHCVQASRAGWLGSGRKLANVEHGKPADQRILDRLADPQTDFRRDRPVEIVDPLAADGRSFDQLLPPAIAKTLDDIPTDALAEPVVFHDDRVIDECRPAEVDF